MKRLLALIILLTAGAGAQEPGHEGSAGEREAAGAGVAGAREAAGAGAAQAQGDAGADAAGAREAAGEGAVRTTEFALAADGTIPAWLVAGPFEQPMVGFGKLADADSIGEATAAPAEGQREKTSMVADGEVSWKPLQPNGAGFVDFHASLGWAHPGDGPEKIWRAKAGYAVAYLHSPSAREVLLLTGSNSQLKVLLNGRTVQSIDRDRNAIRYSDTLRIALVEGQNRLVVRVAQTHRNEQIQFFDPLRWEWGFYARLLAEDGTPARDLRVEIPLRESATSAELVSTFFFKESPDGLRQQFDVVITSREPATRSGRASIVVDGEAHVFQLERVPFGESRHAVYLPPIDVQTIAELAVDMDGERILSGTLLAPEKRYELHLMMLSHTDVGYTDPQPVVIEKHIRTLDAVLDMSRLHPDFKWTLETTWPLVHFEKSRPREQFEELVGLIRQGRIALSPLYTNPFTGWIGEEEMLRSFDAARTYRDRHGISFEAAIYNDVPGFSWILPNVLSEAGAGFLVAGINELFNDYSIQRSLPKVFRWTGSDGTPIVVYRTESYNEAQTYGFIKGLQAMENKMWERLRRHEARGDDFELVLMNTTFGDNGGIPTAEFEAVATWNADYAYPRVVVSNLSDFARAFIGRYDPTELPLVSGDWTSGWDILFQGEPARMIRQRKARQQLAGAEKLLTLARLLDPLQRPLQEDIDGAYDALMLYSAHGSGLEYGYGSPEENAITMAFREKYVRDADLAAEAAHRRATYRLVQPEESFETEGLYVFNTLSYEIDAPVAVQFPEPSGRRFRLIDGASGEVVPSHQQGYTLRFVAMDLPSMGFRKYRLEEVTEIPAVPDASRETIENEYYRLSVDPVSGAVTSLIDRKSGRELVDGSHPLSFGAPLRAVSGGDFDAIPPGDVAVRVRDERLARLVLTVSRTGGPVVETEYVLWEGLDRLDVIHHFDLEKLPETASVEEYGVAFPLLIADPQARLEVLGGYLDPDRDRFVSVEHDAVSLQRAASVSGDDYGVSLVAVDSRVVRWRRISGAEHPVLIANLVNNFPLHWNRSEENAGTWPFRFSLTGRPGPFDAGFTSRFGWQAATEPVVSHTWLRSAPAEMSYLQIDDGRVLLSTMRQAAGGDGILLRLINTDPAETVDANVSSRLFLGMAAERVSFLEEGDQHSPGISIEPSGVLSVRLRPNEIVTVRLRPDTSTNTSLTVPNNLPTEH